MIEKIIPSSDIFLLNSKPINIESNAQFKIEFVLSAQKGEIYSFYVAAIVLGADKKEIVRFIKYIRDFTGVDLKYELVFKTPDRAKFLVLGYRCNTETPYRSDLHIRIPELESIEIHAIHGVRANLSDNYEEYLNVNHEREDPKFSAFLLNQNYENVWDTYSREFGLGSDTKGVTYLGDEWWNEDFVSKVFHKYLEPHLTPDSHVGELGVGGGKYSILVSPLIDTLYGIDISNEMLKRTARRLKEAKHRFVPCKTDGIRIPLSDQSLDFIYSIDSAVHIFPYDLFSYILEFGRVLKPGAKGVIEFADWDLSGSSEKFFFDYGALQRTGKLNTGAFGFLTKPAISEFLKYSGFKILECESLSHRTSIVTFQR